MFPSVYLHVRDWCISVQIKRLLYGYLMSPWVWWREELESSEMENI